MIKSYIERFSAYKETIEYKLEFAKLQVVAAVSDIIEKNDLTQKDIARKMDVSEAQVSKIMRADQNLTLLSMVKLADAIGAELHIAFKDRNAETVQKVVEQIRHAQTATAASVPGFVGFSRIAGQTFVPSGTAKTGYFEPINGACNDVAAA